MDSHQQRVWGRMIDRLEGVDLRDTAAMSKSVEDLRGLFNAVDTRESPCS